MFEFFKKLRKEKTIKEIERRRNERLDKLTIYAMTYGLPLYLVQDILKFEKHGNPYDELVDPTDHLMMLIGASMAYRDSNKIKKVLPLDDERINEIRDFLCKKRVRIQYHPSHGLIYVEDDLLRSKEELNDIVPIVNI